MFSCQYASGFYSMDSSENYRFNHQYQISSSNQMHSTFDLTTFYYNSNKHFKGFLVHEENINQFQNGRLLEDNLVFNRKDASSSSQSAVHSTCHHFTLNQTINPTARRHQAKISFVPTDNRTLKVIVKRKRKRTVFTREQTLALEEIFKQKKYITRENRKAIVDNLQLNDKAVKTWFQNRRSKIRNVQEKTMKQKGDINYINDDRINRVETSEEIGEYNTERLDADVAKKLTREVKNTLSQNIPNFTIENNSDIYGSPVYEPISPASASHSKSEENLSYISLSPEESLRILFDLQAMELL